MSLVVFPFKDERVEIISSNLAVAAASERVAEVWAVASAEDGRMGRVRARAADISGSTGVPITVFAQERMGELRSGKGDGMNTAISHAAKRGFDRVHFYDADITNFDQGWIDGAEAAADRGYRVVRHRFPRAATDAMITWMVTRPGLAVLFPGTLLPRIGQPLGGELLIAGEVIEALAVDPYVISRSDWGIDTVLTHATSVIDDAVYEHHVADGKRHTLYGSLTDIRDMVLECLNAVASLAGRKAPGQQLYSDPPAPVPDDLRQTVAYDVSATRAAIAGSPGPGETEILESLGIDSSAPIEMDETRWLEVLPALLERFRLEDEAWRSAVFRLWVERVIHYTTHQVPGGYDAAMAYLEGTIRVFENRG